MGDLLPVLVWVGLSVWALLILLLLCLVFYDLFNGGR